MTLPIDDTKLVCAIYEASEEELYSELNVFSHKCANKKTRMIKLNRLKVFVKQNLSECFPNMNNLFKTFFW